MAKKAYIGVDGVARKVKKMYLGVNGVARKVKKAYIGVGGLARLFFSSGLQGQKTVWTGGPGSVSGGVQDITCIKYANGYWVVGGRYFDGSYYYARIAYATSLEGPWTTKDLWSAPTGTSMYSNIINSIDYANGYWVAGGTYKSSSSNAKPRIAYATSLTGTWTTKDFWSKSSPNLCVNCFRHNMQEAA